MKMLATVKVRAHERGLLFEETACTRLLRPGRHWLWVPLVRSRVDVLSTRDAWIRHAQLDVIVRSGVLDGEALVVDLNDEQRAVVWLDGRVEAVLRPGLYAFWTTFHDVRVEVFDARVVLLEHASLASILALRGASEALETVSVEPAHAGLFFREGRLVASLGPGTHALWKGAGRASVVVVDLREQVADVAGQDIMTADKVTLRLNAVVTWRVSDPVKAVTEVEDHRQALYREAQLALRAVVGALALDTLLTERDAVARELDGTVRARCAQFGVTVVGLGIRDVILPGEMKELLNKVTEAQKAAEANLITRREEVAAMRSQANTARILESSPTLMRLRELEVLERVASKARLNVLVGDKGLSESVVKLL